jgi:hypothetical protein
MHSAQYQCGTCKHGYEPRGHRITSVTGGVVSFHCEINDSVVLKHCMMKNLLALESDAALLPNQSAW